MNATAMFFSLTCILYFFVTLIMVMQDKVWKQKLIITWVDWNLQKLLWENTWLVQRNLQVKFNKLIKDVCGACFIFLIIIVGVSKGCFIAKRKDMPDVSNFIYTTPCFFFYFITWFFVIFYLFSNHYHCFIIIKIVYIIKIYISRGQFSPSHQEPFVYINSCITIE